jgi:NADH-quinone oxidoreductase subunit C
MHHEIHPSASPATVELHNQIKDALINSFGNDITGSQIDYDFPVFSVAKNRIHDVLEFLKNHNELEFTFLTTMCGVHYPDNAGQEFALVYQLHNMQKNWRVRIKTFMADKDLNVPTATDLWLGANWMERETYDFFGINFTGHPNLVRILNVDDMDYFPLRKEYPLEDQVRRDKVDSMFFICK